MGKRRKWQFFVIVGLVIALIIAFGIIAYSQTPKQRIKKQLVLAERYLEEMDYEQAITVYKSVIEIDSKSVDAYLGLADVYIGLEMYQDAESCLKEGYERTKDDSIAKKISEVEKLLESSCVSTDELKQHGETQQKYNDTEIQSTIIEAEMEYSEEWSVDLEGNYSSWQEGFADWIREHESENIDFYNGYQSCHYQLVYVDDDDVPELFVQGNSEAEGECIVSFYDGKMSQYYLSRIGGTVYRKLQGLVYNQNGNSGYYPVRIGKLYHGKFYKAGSGIEMEEPIEKDGEIIPHSHYEWEGVVLSEDDFWKEVNTVFPLEDADNIYEMGLLDCNEMVDLLEGKTNENLITMDSNLQYEANVFLSNFAETYMEYYDVSSVSDLSLISFAYIHMRINDYDNLEEDMHYSCDEWCYISPYEETNRVLERYMGRSISVEKAEKIPVEEGYRGYHEGKYYWMALDGEQYNQIAIVDRMEKLEDGNIRFVFYVFEIDIDTWWENDYWDEIDKHYYELTKEQADADYTLICRGSGEAVGKPYTYNGRNSYQLVYYSMH